MAKGSPDSDAQVEPAPGPPAPAAPAPPDGVVPSPVPPSLATDPKCENDIQRFACLVSKSEQAQVDAQLSVDMEAMLGGNAVYLPELLARKRDHSVFGALVSDLQCNATSGEGSKMVNWSKHLKHEEPDFSPTFLAVIAILADYFDVDVYATRLNYYRDGSDWKTFHHDSHAYGGRKQREDFTIGASFGASRELAFQHCASERTFAFPQDNGDVFAFSTEVNTRFKHGVPKARHPSRVGARCSIIAWGRRRSLNHRNSGAPAPPKPVPPPIMTPTSPATEEEKPEAKKPKPKKKNRLQSGVGKR